VTLPSPLGILASSKSNVVASNAVRFSAANQRYTRSSFGLVVPATICGWAKMAVNRATYSGLMASSNGTNYLQLGAAGDGVSLGASASSGGLSSNFDFTVGQWVFVAVVINGTDNVYYAVSGTPTLTAGNAGSIAATALNAGSALYVGDDGFGGWFNGSMAALKMWSAALTQAELEAELPKRAAQRTSGLYASYELNGPSLIDSSGNGRTLTAGAGTPALDTSGPPIT